MEYTNQIQKYFAMGDPDNAYKIKGLDLDNRAWVVRFSGGIFGVMIPYEGEAVDEEFANVQLYSGEYRINNNKETCLMLTSSIEKTRNEFAIFCNSFIDPGDSGKARRSLISNPVEWWENWKNLIGNAIKEKKPYAILGELMVFHHFLNRGNKVKWGGPEAASHDIVSDSADYEVKSTLSRYDRVVHITGQFQLQQSTKQLYLYFCRFEENKNGYSINDYIERLVEKGLYREDLEDKLSRQGYPNGNSARDEKYILHESMEYCVDDSFPKITPESMKNGKIPEGIVRISYDVDLSLVKGNPIELE